MHLTGGIEAQGRRPHPVGAHIMPGLRIARHRQADQVRDRPATGQRAARRHRKSRDLRHPADHLPFKKRGRSIAAAKVRPVDRRQKVAQRADNIARTHIPGPEARMDVAHRIGPHVPQHRLIGGLRPDARARQATRERRPDPRRHLLPDRTVAQPRQMVDRLVHDPVAQRPHARPVVRVQGFTSRHRALPRCRRDAAPRMTPRQTLSRLRPVAASPAPTAPASGNAPYRAGSRPRPAWPHTCAW